jgi:hypothetical protein
MLWYKSWLETRWRFLIGFGLLLCSAVGSVLVYPQIARLTASVPVNAPGILGEKIREAMELARSYRGYVWSHWFGQNLAQTGTLFAILLGTASLISESSGALFTLSLPVPRRRLLHVRAAAGLAELFAIVFVPSLLVALLAPAIGEHYGIGAVLIHAFCFFVGAALFFTLSLLLSTIFGDPWRPVMIAVAIAIAVAIVDQLSPVSLFGVFRVMSGERWFREARMPWAGLIAIAAATATIYYGALRNLARRDF